MNVGGMVLMIDYVAFWDLTWIISIFFEIAVFDYMIADYMIT